MKSAKRGRRISPPEVSHLSALGFWLLVAEHEYFVGFDHNPWFRNATVAQILGVEQPHEGHLCWKELDVDLDLESLVHPEKYPLVYK